MHQRQGNVEAVQILSPKQREMSGEEERSILEEEK
jgi:hypothetical protein